MGNVKVLAFEGCKKTEIAFVTECDKESELCEKLNSVNGIKIESLIRVTDY